MANRKLEPGMLVAAGFIVVGYGFVWFYNMVVLQFFYFADREATKRDQCLNGSCYSNSIPMRLYAPLLLIAMVISVWWGKKWPRFRRDLVAGLILSTFNTTFASIAAETVMSAYNVRSVMAEMYLTFSFIWQFVKGLVVPK